MGYSLLASLLQDCPRHPILPLWLLTLGILLLLGSLAFLALPSCTSSPSPSSLKPTPPLLLLLFLTLLLSILLLMALVSWLAVATVWLAEGGTIQQEYQVQQS